MEKMFNEMIEIIYEFALPEMAEHQFEDTTANRISFLKGLRDGWEEDNPPPEAYPWITAVNMELIRLQIKHFTEDF